MLVDVDSGLRNTWLESLADDICELVNRNTEIIVVSSGAITLGRIVLNKRRKHRESVLEGPLRLDESQAAAAIGQIELSHAYTEVLSKRGLHAGQILLTLGDTQDRRRYLNARATISKLLEWHAVPVINENDSVATAEIRYGDNDRLAARVASMMSADLLVLMSDVDGLYRTPPPVNPTNEFLEENLIAEVPEINDSIEQMAGESNSKFARGGMVTKLQAGKIATKAGTAMVITNGRRYHPLMSLASGARATWFLPSSSPVSNRKKWIAGQIEIKGRLFVDTGAATALQNGKSLLCAGVTHIEGNFERGDTVAIVDCNQVEIGRGLVGYDFGDAQEIIGLNNEQIMEKLGVASRSELIHRDDLVINLQNQESEK